MFTTPYAGIRVPDVDDPVLPSSVRDMLTDIEYGITRARGRAAEAARRKSASISGVSAAPIPNSTMTTLSWGYVDFDSEGIVDLGSFPTRITLTRGVWRVNTNVILSAAAPLSTAHVKITGSVYGFAGAANQSTTQMDAALSVSALIPTSGEYVIVEAYQTSGGAGSAFAGRFTATRISSL